MERMIAALNWMSSRLPCSHPGNRDKDNGVIKTDNAVIKCHLLASGNSRSIRWDVSTEWWIVSSFSTELSSLQLQTVFTALHSNTFTTLPFVCCRGHKLMVALVTSDSNKTRFLESMTNVQWGNVKDGIMSHVLSHCSSKHSEVVTDVEFWEAALTVEYVKCSLLLTHKSGFSGTD